MPAEVNMTPVVQETINKEVVESYIFSTVRHDFGIYTERLLLRLVELAQREINGLDFKGGTDIGKVKVGEWGDREIIIPVKDILSGDKMVADENSESGVKVIQDKNYTKAKEAVRNLMGKFLEYEDDKNYRATHILNDVDVDKVSGKMLIRVNRNIWNAMLDFGKGFRKYELETAVKLRGKYSLRIYKLISKQTEPISYLIEDLRKMWGLTDKYRKVDDFVKNTLEAAKKELDEVSPYSFDYVLTASKSAEVNRGRKGRPAMTSVTFFPRHVIRNESVNALRKMASPSMTIGHELYDILKNKFSFDSKGITANIALFDVAQKEFDILLFLDQIAPKALRVDNPQGYVINAVKKHLKESCGIIFEDNVILRTSQKDVTPASGAKSKGPKSLADILGDSGK